MDDENWKQEYKEWKLLKASQIQLLDEGPQTLSQSWLINAMWSDWKDLKTSRPDKLPLHHTSSNQWCKDPWYD